MNAKEAAGYLAKGLDCLRKLALFRSASQPRTRRNGISLAQDDTASSFEEAGLRKRLSQRSCNRALHSFHARGLKTVQKGVTDLPLLTGKLALVSTRGHW